MARPPCLFVGMWMRQGWCRGRDGDRIAKSTLSRVLPRARKSYRAVDCLWVSLSDAAYQRGGARVWGAEQSGVEGQATAKGERKPAQSLAVEPPRDRWSRCG